MSDLPTRQSMHGWWADDSARGVSEILDAYIDGDLLTRVEAANDPEVRRIVLREWKNKTRWEGDDRISMEVGFGAALAVADDE